MGLAGTVMENARTFAFSHASPPERFQVHNWPLEQCLKASQQVICGEAVELKGRAGMNLW